MTSNLHGYLSAGFKAASGSLCTPLVYAIAAFRPSLVRLLVAHGADLKAPGATDTHCRCFWPLQPLVDGVFEDFDAGRPVDGALETLDYLLAAGADVDAYDSRQFGDHLPVLQPALQRLIGLLQVRPSARSAVFDAMATRLIDAGANLNARDDKLDCQ